MVNWWVTLPDFVLVGNQGWWGRWMPSFLLTHRSVPCHGFSAWNLCWLKGRKSQPWPVWLSWLGVFPQSERSSVWFPVRAHAWVVGSVSGRGTYKRQLINVSLSHQCFWFMRSILFENDSKKETTFCGASNYFLHEVEWRERPSTLYRDRRWRCWQQGSLDKWAY